MTVDRTVPVLVVNGFLESGKTTFIKDAVLRDPELRYEKILIITCEEGEVDYDEFSDYAIIHSIDETDELTDDVFIRLSKHYNPTYVVIEYNGMWGMQRLYDTKMPAEWFFLQQLTVIDALSFEGYYSNMKSIFADMLRRSSSVVVNRCSRSDDFKLYKDNIKRCSPKAEIMYLSDEEGIMDVLFEEDLPYDLNADVIVIDDDSYLTWYIDVTENTERYEGKTVEYTGIALKPDYFGKDSFVVGNEIMTCCEDDMQFLGIVCRYKQTELVKEGEFVKVKGKIKSEYASEYDEEGAVLYVDSVGKN